MNAGYCVDYLSNKWKTDDLIQTYRETRKQSIVNKLKQGKHDEYKLKRLQNALWREMARSCTSRLSRSNKLVDPSSMSWQKESDITWLYGPIYTTTMESQVSAPTYHLQDMKPASKRQNTLVQHSDDIWMLECYLSTSTTLCSSRSNSFSSISSTQSSAKMGVHFNPEIIEIEYQPEHPVSPITFPLMEEEEDALWLPLSDYLYNISSVRFFVLLLKSFASFSTIWLLYQRFSRWEKKEKSL